MSKFKHAGELHCRKVRCLIDENLHQIASLDFFQPVMTGATLNTVSAAILQKATCVLQHHENQHVSLIRSDNACGELCCIRSKKTSVPYGLLAEPSVNSRHAQHESAWRSDYGP